MIQNCSGIVHVSGSVRRDLGSRIFHRAGNVTVLNNALLTFKAARDRRELEQLLEWLVCGSWAIKLQLCVLSGRVEPVDTNPQSPFEQALARISFVQVQPRIMEICTCSVWRIEPNAEWRAFSGMRETPRSLYVTVTHRGVVTLRVSFENYEWVDKGVLQTLLEKVKEIVRFASI